MKKGRVFGYIMLAAAFLLFAAIVITEIGAAREMGGSYAVLREQEISEEEMSLLVTYFFGSLCEAGLYVEPTEVSFAYLAEIEKGIFDDDYAGDARYDESKNVIILNGTEYPQKESPNPDYFTGAKRAAAIILEAVNPYSSFTLPLIMHDAELAVPMLAFILYCIKALLWIILPGLGKKTSRT